MRQIRELMAALAFFVSIPACGQQTVNIWPGLAPGTGSEKNEEKVINNRVYNVYQPDLAVYLPVKPDPNHAAVVICPGGTGHSLRADGDKRPNRLGKL